MNKRPENIGAQFSDVRLHGMMLFLEGKEFLGRLALALALLSLAGCKRTCGGELFADTPDYPTNKIVGYYAAIGGGPSLSEEVQIGKGRAAQPGRKMKIQVEAADNSGKSYGSGTVTFLDPPFRTDTWGIGVDSGSAPPEFLAGMAGMREGGVRKFTLPAATSANALTELSDGESHNTVIRYPHGLDMIFTVTLQEVCKPKFCSLTTYAIIDAANASNPGKPPAGDGLLKIKLRRKGIIRRRGRRLGAGR